MWLGMRALDVKIKHLQELGLVKIGYVLINSKKQIWCLKTDKRIEN